MLSAAPKPSISSPPSEATRNMHDELAGAAMRGDLACVQTLLKENGAQISTEARGNALNWAVAGENLPIVQAILEGGAEIPIENRGMAVVSAVKQGRLDIAKILLEGNAQIPIEDWRKTIWQAACERRFDVVEFLLREYCQIRSNQNSEQGPIEKDVEIKKLLKENIGTLNHQERVLMIEDLVGSWTTDKTKEFVLDMALVLSDNGKQVRGLLVTTADILTRYSSPS